MLYVHFMFHFLKTLLKRCFVRFMWCKRGKKQTRTPKVEFQSITTYVFDSSGIIVGVNSTPIIHTT